MEYVLKFLMTDKGLHAVISLTLILGLGYILKPAMAFVVVIAIGLLKEVCDHFSPLHNAQMGDIVADIVGALIGLIFILIVGNIR